MRASKNPEKWHELLRCVDNGDFNAANKIAIKFFGGVDEFYVSKERRIKDEFLLFLFQANKINELNNELNTRAADQASLLNELRDRFEKEVGFLILNRKYVVKNTLALVRYFFSEEEIDKYLITEKNQKMLELTRQKLGKLLLFNEQKSEIEYGLKNVVTLSDSKLDELMQKHKMDNYIVYHDMLFTDPIEFLIVFGFILKKNYRERLFNNEYLKKIFDFCEKDSISFIAKNEVDIETVKRSAYKKIEMLKKYNEVFVEFYARRKRGEKSPNISAALDLQVLITNYYSTAFNFEHGEGDHFLLPKDRFKRMRKRI